MSKIGSEIENSTTEARTELSATAPATIQWGSALLCGCNKGDKIRVGLVGLVGHYLKWIWSVLWDSLFEEK